MLDSSIKILKLFPPELAHTITINALKYLNFKFNTVDDPILSQHLIGPDFPNPLGLAAGFDKNAEVIKSMFSLGFGYVEVGKKHNFENLKDFFKLIYQVLLGQDQGPRLGSFIKLFGIRETIDYIKKLIDN